MNPLCPRLPFSISKVSNYNCDIFENENLMFYCASTTMSTLVLIMLCLMNSFIIPTQSNVGCCLSYQKFYLLSTDERNKQFGEQEHMLTIRKTNSGEFISISTYLDTNIHTYRVHSCEHAFINTHLYYFQIKFPEYFWWHGDIIS